MIDRRRFLTAMGLSAGSLVLPSLSGRVRGALGDPPRRLIVLVSQHGGWMPTWAMNPAGLPTDAVWEQDLNPLAAEDFSPSLAPLHPWRSRTVAIEGLSMVSGDVDPAGVLRHEIGQIHTLTGNEVEMVSGLPIGKSPSIDQLIANHVSRPDRLRSIELSVGDQSPVVNYRDRMQPLLGESRMPVAHERLFGLVNGGSSGSDVQREQGTLLDRVQGRYEALGAQLSAEDRHKLDVHRDLVRDLSLQIDGLMNTSCAVPEVSAGDDYSAEWTAAATMLTSAMSCDVVRVATINLDTVPAAQLGIAGEDIHDAYAHELARSELAVQVMTDYYAYHSAQVAELLGLLDGIPEGDGTMLDHTLVLWTSELADGVHGFDRMPVLLFGGQAWTTGRYLHYPSDTPYEAWVWDGVRRPSAGRPHQRLLSSVMRAFGVPDPQTGGDWSAMPIRELPGAAGATIDCTGVLDELFAGVSP
ncbi:MAG: DUF1552 domain-containing protein [Deltaproteobacteria bacterium]|nr:DUF1552 domain-containing protein [Deltaproteobacteria bacterium]